MTRQPKTKPENTADALERLVHQFADPLSFFRELIQNSIDAGTPEVEIYFEYQDGLMTLHIDDFGEGMDRQIIDTRLTRLFSSGKEDDYTKIGRFGIGFVSVFALQPDAVVVDTSRGGESWRLLFGVDRTFQRISLDLPVDGTKIRILKEMEQADYEELRRRAPEVVKFWCRYVEPQISVDGQVINQRLGIESPCQVRLREEGTEIVVAYGGLETGEQICGYYNRGITLYEEPAQGLTCFKIDSRYLEHTLTRDDVLRDANYDKAMAKVEDLRVGALPVQLFQQLEAALAVENAGSSHYTAAAELQQLGRLAARQVVAWQEQDRKSLERVEQFRVLRCHDGALLSIADARQGLRDGKIYRAFGASPVVEALAARGDLIVQSKHRDFAWYLLDALHQPLAPEADKLFCRPARLATVPGGADELMAGVRRLLDDHGAKISAIEIASLGYSRSPVRRRVAITQRRFGELTPLDQVEELSDRLLARRRVVVLNADHRTIKTLLKLAERERELAAFLVVKLLYLRTDLTPELDSRLALLALEARWQRLPS